MRNNYKVNVSLGQNDTRNGADLNQYLEVSTYHECSDGKVFIAELFKELVYSAFGDLMLSSHDGHSYFDYFLVDNLFDNSAETLAQEMVKEFDIVNIEICDSIGRNIFSIKNNG